MHSASDNIKFTPYNDANEVVDDLFESLCSKYEDDLDTSIKEMIFFFYSVQLMYYKFHKVSFKRGGSYIDYPDCTKNKKAIINEKKRR